jgi:hypothetical protein
VDTGRLLDLTVVQQGSGLGDFASIWMPKLLVVVRGKTERLDLAMPDLAERVRFGARGVSVGESSEINWRHTRFEELADLVVAVADLGSPQVKGVVDTGDYFQASVVTGALDGAPFHFRVEQMQSGYQGRDAEKLAAFMRLVLKVADLDAADPRWSAMVHAR